MEVITSFGIDIRLLIASIINFVILLIILNKVLYKPLLDTLDQRKKTIEESLKNADEIQKKLKETEENERQILHKAKVEAQVMISKAEASAVVRQKEILEQAGVQAKQIISATEAKLEQQAKEMQKQIQAELADMIVIATRSILKDKTPDSVNKDYVQSTLNAITRK